MSHRAFKDRVYAQFSRISQALASEKRLELVDLLAQAPRHVEALATETEMSVANVSQHLQTLKAAGLVEARRSGRKTIYSLMGDDVLALWLSLRSVAEDRLAEVGRATSEVVPERNAELALSRGELERLFGTEGVILIDVRPTIEFEAGHLPGAISVPIDQLENRLSQIPRDCRVIVYCRGEYCLFADEAVALLREKGYEAMRLAGGWPEWKAEDRPTSKTTRAQG